MTLIPWFWLFIKLFHEGGPYYIGTSPVICGATVTVKSININKVTNCTYLVVPRKR